MFDGYKVVTGFPLDIDSEIIIALSSVTKIFIAEPNKAAKLKFLSP